MNYRKGDIVSVQGTVKYNQSGDDDHLFVSVTGSHEDLWVNPKVLSLIQARFEIGDAVRWFDGVGNVIAIANDHAWIIMPDGNYCTRHFSMIERAPESKAEPEEDDIGPVEEFSDVNQL